jgi:hypothetical protein
MDRDDLYGLPLDRFVPERNALAKALRTAGDSEQAAEVAALRKPSVAAWAVNQLLRTQRRPMSELFEAGDGLRDAHQQVLTGRGHGRTLRDAVERERTAVDALTGAARGLLTSEGHELSPTVIDRVTDTLHAAALDEDAREQVREGRLERELRHVGLGGLGSPEAPAQPPAPLRRRAEPRAPKGSARPRTAGLGDARAEVEAARAKAEAQARARAEARATEREARRQLERATRAAAAARERHDRATQALSETQIQLDQAEADLRKAQAQLRDAEEAVRSVSDRAR